MADHEQQTSAAAAAAAAAAATTTTADAVTVTSTAAAAETEAPQLPAAAAATAAADPVRKTVCNIKDLQLQSRRGTKFTVGEREVILFRIGPNEVSCMDSMCYHMG